MWERWDGWTPNAGFESETMNSFNHYAFGSVGQYLYSIVGGINSTSPGYKTMLIGPTRGPGLFWASTSYNSTRGLISTAWTNVGAAFNLTVTIPPNTTAQIEVPTTDPSAVMESGVLATNSPGVVYLGYSKGLASYAVGSGTYFWSAPIQPEVASSETNAVFAGGNFPVLPPGDLLTNSSVSVVSNSLTFGTENHLTFHALNNGLIGDPGSTNDSVEISGGMITYYLGPGPGGAGYTLTNLGAYTAWRDDGREDANYAVDCSTNGLSYFQLADVAYNPSPYPTLDGTDGTLTSLAVANLTGVHFLRWDFTAAQQNGGVGYTELFALGVPTSPPVAASVAAILMTGQTNFVLNLSGLSAGTSYLIQSTTNLASPFWFTETNFVAGQSAATFSDSAVSNAAKFYRVVSY
jgi:hypothetical protein